MGVVDDKWDATDGFVYLSAIYLEIERRRRNKGKTNTWTLFKGSKYIQSF